jgi:hypothetical protein
LVSLGGRELKERIAERSDSLWATWTGGFTGIPKRAFTPGIWQFWRVLSSVVVRESPLRKVKAWVS